MRYILNFFQVIIIITACTVFSIIGVILMIPSKDTKWAVDLISNKMWSRIVVWVAGIKLEVTGRENIDRNNDYIYVSNHESSLDIPVIFQTTRIPLFFIAKQELKKIPVVGWYISAARMIFIDRRDHEKAMESMRNAAKIIKSGKSILSFPEGTRSRDGKLMIFKRGAFKIAIEGNVGIVPLAISGTREVNSPGSFKITPGIVKTSIGKPIFPGDHPDLNVDQLAAKVRGIVGQMIDEMEKD
jgi:1-acyl-sn-glycerol-3-phosphate acyltransferase